MTGSGAAILGMGAYLPARIMTNQDWTQYVDTSDDWITSRTGIKRRRIAAGDQTTVDLAEAAARNALADAGLRPDQVDEIIVATDTPEMPVPDTASFLQHRLQAREVASYTLGGSGCSGFLQAMSIATSRTQCGAGTILVVGVELLTRMISWRDRNTAVLFGDAAGSVIVGSAAGFARIVTVLAGTIGGHADALALEVGGTKHPFSLEAAQAGLHQRAVMKGREVFKYAVHWMGEAALRVLREAGMSLKDVALVIPHQANLRIIEALAKALQVPLERVFINVHEYGNTGSASIPLALWEASKSGRIRRGDIVLLTSFGAGFHWAAALLQF